MRPLTHWANVGKNTNGSHPAWVIHSWFLLFLLISLVLLSGTNLLHKLDKWPCYNSSQAAFLYCNIYTVPLYTGSMWSSFWSWFYRALQLRDAVSPRIHKFWTLALKKNKQTYLFIYLLYLLASVSPSSFLPSLSPPSPICFPSTIHSSSPSV